MVLFEDNYQDYEADGHKRLDTDPDQPHQIRYKRPAVALARRFAGDAARDLRGRRTWSRRSSEAGRTSG